MFSKHVKLWIFITISIMIVYNLWEIYETVDGIYEGFTQIGIFELGQSVGINPIIILIVFCPLIGLIFRFVGSILALEVVNLAWRKQTHTFSDLSNKISKVVLMEIIYLISIIPNFFFITVIGTPLIFASYIIQTFLTIPFLFILRRKISKNSEQTIGSDLNKSIGLTFVAYFGAIWVNHVTRWFDMAITSGAQVLLTSLNPLGAINSFVVLSLALVFAVIGYLKLSNKGITSKWFGLSLTLTGLHFIILLAFYALLNSLHVVYLFEIWAVPLLGLGLSIVLADLKNQSTNLE